MVSPTSAELVHIDRIGRDTVKCHFSFGIFNSKQPNARYTLFDAPCMKTQEFKLVRFALADIKLINNRVFTSRKEHICVIRQYSQFVSRSSVRS
mgnify:CR=1 FL=1